MRNQTLGVIAYNVKTMNIISVNILYNALPCDSDADLGIVCITLNNTFFDTLQ